jgi:hypothetical protein
MFEWLDDEIRLIKTRKFHVIDGPAGQPLREAIQRTDLHVPSSYKEFVLRFGNAKLYKQLDYYKIGVLASPIEEIVQETGDTAYRFGHYDSADAYFTESVSHRGEETPVLEGRRGGLQRQADGFEAWLLKRCKLARNTYTKEQWAAIVAGPPPFTPGESRILEARRQLSCRIAGVTPQGNLLFEVHNGSDVVLPFLSIGLRWKENGLQAGIWLPISHVPPGQTAVVEHETYKKVTNLTQIEFFVKPDPEPEDRERYWEFKALSP